MASVTMSQAPSNYSSTSSSTSNYSENDLTSNFGRIKFTDGPTLIVCDIDSDGCDNSSTKKPTEDGKMMVISPSSSSSTITTTGSITKSVIPTECTNGSLKLSSSTHSMKETIERSPSTSSLSVPIVDVDEKRPPLPDENMMIDESF